jgi:F420H(2)-dependent quinone reductase
MGTEAAMGQARPYSARQEAFGNRVIRVGSAIQSGFYRLSGGRIGGKFLRGAPVGILTHVGRKSGQVRHTPLIYAPLGDTIVIAASKGGFTTHPDWYWNITANPDVSFQVGSEDTPMRARPATATERPDLWVHLDRTYRDFAEYRERAGAAGREIPLFVLEPR